MNIRYFLIRVTNRIILISSTLVAMAARIAGIYLIGQYLYQPFAYTGNYLVQLASDINAVGDSWEGTFQYIESRLNQVVDISELKHYADQLIAFIQNPTLTVYLALRRLYPSIIEFTENPFGFLRPFVVSIIHEIMGAIQDINVLVNNALTVFIPDFHLFRYNPVAWVIERIREYSSVLGQLITDPDGFIRERVRMFFPDLWEFMQDPRAYIIEKMVEGLEVLADRYLLRLLKVAENILQAIF